MPSWRTISRRAISSAAAQALTALLGLWTSSCGPLFGGFTTDNPDNCVRNPALCPGPALACNQLTKLCEPAVSLAAVEPPGGSNLGGELVTLTGDRFVPGLEVLFDGVPATAVAITGGQQLTAVTPPRPIPRVMQAMHSRRRVVLRRWKHPSAPNPSPRRAKNASKTAANRVN